MPPPITPETKWYCHACESYFPEPIRSNSANEPSDSPLCPNCHSDVVEEREEDDPVDDFLYPTPRDSAFPDPEDIPLPASHAGSRPSSSLASNRGDPFPNSFNPPSMTGNRDRNRPARNTDSHNNGGWDAGGGAGGTGLLGLLGNAFFGQGNASQSSSSSNSNGPQFRTFTFGNANPTAPAHGSSSGFGASITFGGSSRIRRDENGRIPLPVTPLEERERERQRLGLAPEGDEDFQQFMQSMFGGPAQAQNRAGARGQEQRQAEPFGEQNMGNPFRPQQRANERPPETIEEMMQQLLGSLLDAQGSNGVLMGPMGGAMFNDRAGAGGFGGEGMGMRGGGIRFGPMGMEMFGDMAGGRGGGTGGNFGDYVFTQEGFESVMERMMEAAGNQNRPPPASENVIERLPRLVVDQAMLDKNKDNNTCNVCFDEFELGNQIIQLPCKHFYHNDCLVPWLKQNGTCPVCRFSVVPENERNNGSAGNAFQAALSGVTNAISAAAASASVPHAQNQSTPPATTSVTPAAPNNNQQADPINDPDDVPNPFAGIFGGIANFFGYNSHPAPNSQGQAEPSSNRSPTQSSSQERPQSQLRNPEPRMPGGFQAGTNSATGSQSVSSETGNSSTPGPSINAPTSGLNLDNAGTQATQPSVEAYPNAIPDDYKERMKRKEEESRRR